MKLLLTPALLVLLSLRSGDAVAPRFAPDPGTVLKRTFVAEAEYRLTDLTASIDGQPLEHPGDLPAYTSSFSERIAVTDVLESVAEGRPSAFVRTFDELQQENSEGLDGEETSTALSSPLQGRKMRYKFDSEEQRYFVEPADDEDLDEAIASSLAADMDLLLVLPDREVAEGDEWEIDPKLYLAFMWPGGLLDFHPEGEEVTEEERESSRQTIARIDGTGTARLEELREEDGVPVAVIHVEMEITTGSDRTQPASEEEGLERPEVTIEVEIQRKLDGTILWDLQHGHALSAEFECKASRLHSEAWGATAEQDGEEVEVDIERARLFEGTIRYSAEIEEK